MSSDIWFVLGIVLAIVGVWYGFRGPELSDRAVNRLMLATGLVVAAAVLAFLAALTLHTVVASPPSHGPTVTPTLTQAPRP